MKQNRWILSIILIFILLLMADCVQKDDFPILRGPNLGQKPPGMTPEVFAPGIVSTNQDEINSVFSICGKEFYFSRDTYKNVSKAGRDYTIMVMSKEKRGWTEPQVASFAGEYMNGDMCITYDNRFLFYCSDRPIVQGDERKKDADIWYVERKIGGWSEPRHAGPVINSNKNEWYPTITKKGILYFSSSKNGLGGSDIHRAKFVDESFRESENIGKPVNSKYNEGDVFISQDERYLIVVSIDRPNGFGSGDLYISFRYPDGSWSVPENMGEPINSDALEYCPMVSPDGKYLFFTSRRRGNDDIYWVDAKIIEELKPVDLR